MCSHEKIHLDFFETCNEFGSMDGSRSNKIMDNSNNSGSQLFVETDELNKSKLEEIDLIPMCDDSFLENINLSFNQDIDINHPKGKSCTQGKQCIYKPPCSYRLGETAIQNDQNINPTEQYNSPDIFNINLEENEEHIDTKEQAWDMSICVSNSAKKDLLLNEVANSQNVPISPGLSELILSTWIPSEGSPPLKKANCRVGDNLIRTALRKRPNSQFKLGLSQRIPQRALFSSPRSTNAINKCEDLFFGLPNRVKLLIKRFKGITSLYEWQEECLRLPAINSRKNLVYALPTSGGKTLVAEILVLKEVLSRQKNVLFVLPYVSIAQEKVRAFSPFAVELGFLVEEYAGSRGIYPPQKRRRKRSVYVATIEKALGLVHSLIEVQRLQELGLVVIDELHLIGEPKRGAHLESMLTKLMYIKGDIQIIGMSATIGNLHDIASFLNADIYTEDFRPVELVEYVKVDDELFKVDYSIVGDVPLAFHSRVSFTYSQEQKQRDPDQIGALVREVAPEHSCLVFCASKKNCENVALLICNAFDRNVVEYKNNEKKALFKALVAEGNGTVCSILKKTLPFGVAYHHSGLTTAERNLLEEAFLAKTICCICCTSTLAAGVNLPARRVILRSPFIGTQLLSLSRYKQMIGRAGRTGMGDRGESFLICRPQDAAKVGELLSSGMDVCVSQLDGSGLASLVLSCVDLGLTTDTAGLRKLAQCSLLASQVPHHAIDLDAKVEAAVCTLVDVGALISDCDQLALSNIGKAAVKANIDLDTAQRLYTDMKTAQDSLVLLSHLHLLYLVTPYSCLDQIHFRQQPFCNAFMELGAKEIQAAKILGIGEHCIAQLMTGRPIKGSLNQTIHRFYLSLILFDLWGQKSVWSISNKYTLPRGLINNLLVSASAFSASVVRFCEVLDDMWCFKLLLSEMSSRLTHCCNAELLPLMELPAVKIGRAKQLFNAGFKTLNILAKTDPNILVQTIDHMPRRVAHQIVAAAKLILLTKADSLQEEAEDVLEGL